jgi:GT2 family glycosyltransferase
MTLPKVSVLIVTFNGYEFARRCIAEVLKNTYPDYEVILVDNGSNDDTVAKIRDEFADAVKVLALPTNLGPSAARNRAMPMVTGEFIATLDNDTEPDPQWLVNGVARMVVDPKLAVLQCRLMLNKARDRFDYVGDYLGSFGFLIQPVNGGDRDVGQANDECVIFSAKSAGMIVRRDAFIEVGGFDEDYFIYVEETDLCLRIWLAGYTALYLPTSVVYHEFGSSQLALGTELYTRVGRFHGTKNYVTTLLKSLEGPTLLRMLPIHLSLWFAWALLNFVRGRRRSAFWILEGLWWNVRNVRRTLVKRKTIQGKRTISDRELLRRVGRRDSVSNLFRKTKTQETSLGNYQAHRL